jgi:hypothetical protein
VDERERDHQFKKNEFETDENENQSEHYMFAILEPRAQTNIAHILNKGYSTKESRAELIITSSTASKDPVAPSTATRCRSFEEPFLNTIK